jgi:hypothetical protein
MDHQTFAQILGNYGEFVGAIAVVGTLFYLAIQIRNSARQNAIQHTWDSLNAFCDRLSESVETASIINRGRDDREALDVNESLVFRFIHLRLLNTLESWHLLLEDIKDRDFVEQQQQNIADLIVYFMDYPNTRQIWSEHRDQFAPGIRKFVDTRLAG